MKSNMADHKQSENSRTGQSRRKTCQERGDEDCPSENEREFESLEYEEDVYYSALTTTPSFDDIDEVGDDVDQLVVHCWRDSNGEIDEIVVDDGNLSVETQFLPEESESRDGASNSGRRKRRSVRVIFQDLSKPYLAKISNSQNYKKFLELVKGAAEERSEIVLRVAIFFFFHFGEFRCLRVKSGGRDFIVTICLLVFEVEGDISLKIIFNEISNLLFNFILVPLD